jgi:transposase InsO family protein
MSLAAFIASQRTDHRVPHALACRALDVSESWFYKWRNRPPTRRQRRRAELDAKVKAFFDASGGTYGSPRILADLRDDGERVSKKTVEDSMARQGLVARPKRRRRGLTKADASAPPVPDLLRRDFSVEGPDQKWCGDFKQIDTDEGPTFLASVEDLFSRRLVGFALSDDYPDATFAKAAINMAVAVRGGDVRGVVFHSDRGSQYSAKAFAAACEQLSITRSMGRVGSALDNAAAESFFSTLHHELLSRRRFATKAEARRSVATWIDDFYNRVRRHSTCDMKSPVAYETDHQRASEQARLESLDAA